MTARISLISGPCALIERAYSRSSRREMRVSRQKLANVDFLELNEAFAAQVLACTRSFGLPDSTEKVNPNGGAIALGHPLGMSGARLVLTASRHLQRTRARHAIVSMCVGVGQGMAMLLERV